MSGSLNLLVLGGTGFVGSWVVDTAVADGHNVSVLNRGMSGTSPAGVTSLRADRNVRSEVRAALAGRQFDAVIDPHGYMPNPETVAEVALALPDVQSYVFVSSVSAYTDWPGRENRGEHEPTFTEGEGYGPGKAACERALEAVLPGRVFSVRPGLILGPRDNGGQLTYLLDRINQGGRVVAPGSPDTPIAFIDARDLARFLVDSAVARRSGAANANSRPGHTTMGGLMDLCKQVTGSDAEMVWVPEDVLVSHGIANWLSLPFFIPLSEMPGMWQINTDLARSMGLTNRPALDTVADTWAWVRGLDQIPLLPGWPQPRLERAQEEELLSALV